MLLDGGGKKLLLFAHEELQNDHQARESRVLIQHEFDVSAL